jgi:hypothetical protein
MKMKKCIWFLEQMMVSLKFGIIKLKLACILLRQLTSKMLLRSYSTQIFQSFYQQVKMILSIFGMQQLTEMNRH